MKVQRGKFICITTCLLLIFDDSVISENRFPQSSRYAIYINPDLDDFSLFAKSYKTLDLGLGFPNYATPDFMKNALIAVSQEPDEMLFNQYTGFAGHPRLLNIVARFYSKLINQELSPEKNVMITIGATEAVFTAIEGITFLGNEWIVFEPFYDPYPPMISFAGGIIRYAQLKPTKTSGVVTSQDWTFDRDELANLFNDNTKGILLNNPHNPTGKVFTRDELQFIADLAIRYNVVVISDEVYEWLIYEPTVEHIRIATLPGMFEQTITIGSASKAFAATGWRVGWAYGPTDLITYMKKANEYSVLCNTTPLQEAFARALERVYEEFDQPDSYLRQLPLVLKAKRDRVVETFTKVGMTPFIPDAGFFVMSNWTGMVNKSQFAVPANNGRSNKDMGFAMWLVKSLGIQVYPASVYFKEENQPFGEQFIRCCFAKTDDTLAQVSLILLEYANDTENLTGN